MNTIIVDILVGLIVAGLAYIGLRLIFFAVFRSWFQAKNFTEKEEQNDVIQKKGSSEKRTIVGESQREL
jgi:hypothetical protein